MKFPPAKPTATDSAPINPARCSRRAALGAGALAVGGCLAGVARLQGAETARARRYEGLVTRDYLGELKTEVRVEGKVFTEGPAWDGAGSLFFTNGSQAHILRWDVAAKKLSVFRENSNGANGTVFDASGRLLVCEAGTKDAGRVTRIDVATGKLTVLADSFGGHLLGAPNDLTVDARGRIYFTSRLANTDPKLGNVNAVYRIDPDGRVARILASPEIDMPNGVDVSVGSKLLYLIESDGRLNRARSIRTYDLQADGTVANGRILHDFYPGRGGDGLCVDVAGNLYVAAGLHKTRGSSETLDTRPGIHVLSPQGRLLAFLETPEDTLTNCTFGGADMRTLFITCGRFLLSCRTQLAGMRVGG